ncbi:MAG TPA: hypothetical protein VF032_19915 [Thermoleophilaceae bacterium]
MPTVIAHHEVEDTEHWLSSARREEVLGSLGASNIRTFVSQQNPQQVAVLMDVADLDVMMAALASPSPELVDAMEHDTVLPETISILVQS